jgi:predicted component of type VI protein secretion system
MYSEQQQIYWHSGLYLQPQHFQSLDLHHEWQLAQRIQLAQPYNHGLIEVEINKAGRLCGQCRSHPLYHAWRDILIDARKLPN